MTSSVATALTDDITAAAAIDREGRRLGAEEERTATLAFLLEQADHTDCPADVRMLAGVIERGLHRKGA
jgi:hypothetical protein